MSPVPCLCSGIQEGPASTPPFRSSYQGASVPFQLLKKLTILERNSTLLEGAESDFSGYVACHLETKRLP